MRLSDIYTRHVITADPGDSLASIARKMEEHNVGTIVVLEDARPVGIVTDRDVALARVLQQQHPGPGRQRHQVPAVADRLGSPAARADRAVGGGLGNHAAEISRGAPEFACRRAFQG